MIYFVQAVDGGPIKIGYTKDFEVRHGQLEKHFGKSLALLKTMPGDRRREKQLHKKFAHLRFPKSEQFVPAKELLEFIGKPLLAHPDPYGVEYMQPASNCRMTKIDAEALRLAKLVATFHGINFTDYLNEAIRSAAFSAFEAIKAKHSEAS